MAFNRLGVMDRLMDWLDDDDVLDFDDFDNDWFVPVKRSRLMNYYWYPCQSTSSSSSSSSPSPRSRKEYRNRKRSAPLQIKRNEETQFKQVEPLTTTIVPSESIEQTTSADLDNFKLEYTLRDFAPTEIKVKLSDDAKTVEIYAKHEEGSKDSTQYESREFLRKNELPDNVLVDQLRCKLNKDGLLQIEAPIRKPESEEAKKVRVIPIEYPNMATDNSKKKEEEHQDSKKGKQDDEVVVVE